jgi:uncharacterized membrane protein YoaK (UPF0700 family)
MTPIARNALWLPVLFAFTAGFVDTAGFIGLKGLFTAHVTGNFVVIGAALVTGGGGLISKLLALPTFIVCVALAHLFEQKFAKRSGSAMSWLQVALLLAFMGLALAATPIHNADAPLAVIAGLTGVAAMAVQNAAARGSYSELAPTTVMTGNVTQVTIDIMARLKLKTATPPTIQVRLKKMWPAIIGFLMGALSGAGSFFLLGFWCLLLPIVAIACAAILASRTTSTPDAASI